MKNSKLGTFFAFLVSGLFVAGAVWLFFNRQTAIDYISVWSYTAPSEVVEVANRSGFTDKGRFIFYATQPEVSSPSDFNKSCPRQESGSPILGCYTTDDRIYIYSISNQKLDGMKEVTAAHEMLHAVWSRTSSEDVAKLTTELEAAYAKLDNAEITKRMEYYQRNEPGEFANELHSILGTEAQSLGEPLESYYEQYFSRSKILALHQQYSSVYMALYNRADELYANMETLSATIEKQSSDYESATSQLKADIESFNSRASSGSFATQSQFNSERANLVARSSALETTRQQINANIETYNSYYTEYQDISQQIEVLNNSIDSYKEIDETPSI